MRDSLPTFEKKNIYFMSLIDLVNFKTRVIGCSAVMAIGQLISNAIGNPATQAAAGIIGGPIAVEISCPIAIIALHPITLVLKLAKSISGIKSILLFSKVSSNYILHACV